MSEPNTSEPLHSSWTRQAMRVAGSASFATSPNRYTVVPPMGGRNTERSGRVTSSGNMPAVCSNSVRRRLRLGGAEALGDARQIPDRVDGRLDHRYRAALVHDGAVVGEAAGRPRPAGSRRCRAARGSRRCWGGCPCLRRSRARRPPPPCDPTGPATRWCARRSTARTGRWSAAGCVLARSGRRSGFRAPDETASAR